MGFSWPAVVNPRKICKAVLPPSAQMGTSPQLRSWFSRISRLVWLSSTTRTT